MSLSGLVITREVYPVPGPAVVPSVRFAPTSRSFAFVVVIAPLFASALVPDAPVAPSSGAAGSSPAYSAILMSGTAAAPLNVTVTVLAPPPTFFA
jgi:hypothetical protein